ncbi:DUF6538 domain-containing protein [Rhodoplanes sp. SY1]|uniref:DUF6538 domain-containing protein n=1 Tax=Rhodoplanes sp. SY1 TaxID=3166646 RepID=UPI0038B4F543
MACPTKRKGSDNWYFRRKLPADLQRILASLPKSRRPPGWHKQHIVISIGTADRGTAKAKCPEIAAAVVRQMQALRKGPAPLTPKQIAGLSGLVYRASPKAWKRTRCSRRSSGGRSPRRTATRGSGNTAWVTREVLPAIRKTAATSWPAPTRRPWRWARPR